MASSDAGYRGQFTIKHLTFDPNYRPVKYKNWVQFKNLNATSTESLENGIWGNLVLDAFYGNKFQGRYLFQAGSHMGGSLILSCRVVQ